MESLFLRDRRGVPSTFSNLHSALWFIQFFRNHRVPSEKRVVDSARGERWTDIKDDEEVPVSWCDPENVHVYLYVDLDAEMRAAERLYDKLWGKDLSVILEEISDNGNTWKYVPKKHMDSLELMKLGYPDKHSLHL
ncbi:hypothetical protein EDB92DRAFT_1952030 [Lactarius akahatsu]|uniref:Uncharacterized protein n=1 Tax=Lactarius akahatsu TaxID=416441 RepID=A0AAD4L921_9AGAM|nr:hypothetical protein EDB92DRAFT_1952030 [Lactarius akahatsu]